MSIKKVVQSNKYLYWFVRQERKIQYCLVPTLQFYIKHFIRKYRLLKSEGLYRIEKYHNKHLGERCFIIATGPSLVVEDLEKLSNEITIGMNSICKIGGKTDWRPTYYAIQDLIVYQNLKDDIKKLPSNITTFIPDNLQKKYKLKDKRYVGFPICAMNHLVNPNADNIKFSDDSFNVVYDGYTITYSILQLAVYMGFKEIYLLGADCSYAKQGAQHFIETGVVDPYSHIAGERMIRSYKVAKEYADSHGIKIYNATRGGYLEVFERISMDNIKFKTM